MAMRGADAGVQQTQIVVNFSLGGDRRSRVAADGFLFNGYGWRQSLNVLNMRLLHLIKELAGISRETLDIAALPFGINSVEGKRRLSRPAQTGDHHKLIARDG